MNHHPINYTRLGALLLGLSIAPLHAQGSNVNNSILIPTPTSEDGVWSVGTDNSLVGDSDFHKGYLLPIADYDGASRITGRVDAKLGPAKDAHDYDSWEVVRLTDGAGLSPSWTLALDVKISSIEGELSDAAYGIILHDYKSITTTYSEIHEVAGSVTIIDFEGDSTEKTRPAAYGVEVGAYYDVETLSTHVRASDSSAAIGYQFNAGTRIGVTSDGTAIKGAGITGKIEIDEVSQGVGIYFNGVDDFNSNAAEPAVGYISSEISIKSTDKAVDAAIGIYVDGTGADNDVKGELSGIFAGSIAIDVLYDSVAQTSLNPIVSGILISQKAGETDLSDSMTFGDGAYISAQYKIAGSETRLLGDSIDFESSSDNALQITTENDGDTVTLIGNIRSYSNTGKTPRQNDLVLLQGDYRLTADEIEASKLSLGSLESGAISDASLTLTQQTLIEDIQSIALAVHSSEAGDFSHIIIEEGVTLDASNLQSIDIHLGDILETSTDYSITVISGLLDELNSVVNIYDEAGTELWSIDLSAEASQLYETRALSAGIFQVAYNPTGLTISSYLPENFDIAPEPTTGTLSLLALTLLITRRRRGN